VIIVHLDAGLSAIHPEGDRVRAVLLAVVHGHDMVPAAWLKGFFGGHLERFFRKALDDMDRRTSLGEEQIPAAVALGFIHAREPRAAGLFFNVEESPVAGFAGASDRRRGFFDRRSIRNLRSLAEGPGAPLAWARPF